MERNSVELAAIVERIRQAFVPLQESLLLVAKIARDFGEAVERAEQETQAMRNKRAMRKGRK